MYIYTQTDPQLQLSYAILIFFSSTFTEWKAGLWDIKGSEGYIYVAFKNQSD